MTVAAIKDMEDYMEEIEETENILQKKSRKRERRKNYKRHIERLKFIANNPAHYPPGAYYKERKDGKGLYYFNIERGKSSAIIKKRSNKAVRKSGQALKGGQYKKIFSYWYELI